MESDGFGQKTIFLEHEAGYPDKSDLVIKSPDDYGRLRPFDTGKAIRCQQLIRMDDIMANERGDRVPVIAIIQEPLVTLGNMWGIEKLLVDCLRYPEAVRQGVGTVVDAIIERLKALIDVGVKYMLLCHDHGNQRMLSEKLFLPIEREGLSRWHEVVKQNSTGIAIPDCGPTPYIDATFTICDFDCFQLCYLLTGCTSWQEFKENMEKICIMGSLVPVQAALLEAQELKLK